MDRDFIRQIYKGKTIGRILLNKEIARVSPEITGDVLDLAGSKNASYQPYLSKNARVTAANITKDGVDVYADVNKALPFPDASFDTVLFLNALYIVLDRPAFYKEVKRILRPSGILYIATPFIANEMPEPHDYCRLTKEGLEKELNEAGFAKTTTTRLGDRFSSAVQLLHPAWRFNTVRFLVYSLALFLDTMIPQKVRDEHPAPMGYFSITKRG